MIKKTERFRVWLKFTYYFLYSIRNRRPWSLSPLTWIRLYYRGFLPNKLNLFGLDKAKNWKPYLNDRQELLTQYIDGEYGIVINDKLLSTMVLRGSARIPQTWAVIKNGKISTPVSRKTDTLQSILREKGKAILKPTDCCGGKGVVLLEYRDGVYLRNRQAADKTELESMVSESGTFLLTEFINQGDYASALYPDTVNTVRMITMLDPETRKPFIAGATQRIGTSQSFPVDNISSGGLGCVVDLRTGRLEKASRVFMEIPLRWIERHPESGIEFEKQVIPQWEEICAEIISLAQSLPMIPYIAWDVAILNDGISIIETNSWSDLNMYQTMKPLPEDPVIRRFFEHHGVIRKRPPHFNAGKENE